VNPVIVIAKGAPAKLREQNDVRCAALCVQYRGRHRGFVCRLQNQQGERFPVRRRNTRVGHREGRAEGLLDQRPIFPCGIGDFHVAVYPDAQFATQDIDLLRLQRPEVLRNGVKPGTGA